MNAMMNLGILAHKYAWPDFVPNVPPDDHGWFGECNEYVLSLLLGDETKVVLELGSWLGKSTRFILEKAPNAEVIAVDHWLGTKQITDDAPDCAAKLPLLYETFLANCQKYKSRLIPMRRNTVEAMDEIFRMGIRPNVIYLDAAHDYDSAKADLKKIGECFPEALLAGDDFSPKWDGVMRAVWQYAEDGCRGMVFASHAWAMMGAWRKGSLDGIKRKEKGTA